MPASLRCFIDAARAAVARAIAQVMNDAKREKELRDAEHRARLAELDSRILAVSDLERRVAERLASLKDGADGVSVSIDDVTPILIAEIGRRVAELPAPKDGVDGKDADPAFVVESIREAVAALPAPQKGDKGDDGAMGALPLVKAWDDRVHYQGNVVTHAGSLYQASRDTAKEPPHADWICLAAAGAKGQDGRSFTIRGTHRDGEAYQMLDVVSLNGASFAAKRDDPGACPGDGWQLIAKQGGPGKPGDPGRPGKVERGPKVEHLSIDDEGLLTLRHEDGSTVTCDFYPLLRKLK